MAATPAEARSTAGTLAGRLGRANLLDAAGTALAAGILVLFFVGPEPFADLSDKRLTELVQAGDAATNAVFIGTALVGGALAGLTRPRGLRALARPPMVLLVGWLALTAALCPDPGTALRRLVLALITLLLAAVVPLLVADLRRLAMVLALGAGAAVALSWGGVILAPELAIHQPADVSETDLAGSWRGLYSHKNAAGPMMGVFVFVGLFVARAWSPAVGLAIAAAAAAFLPFTLAKSAAALCPAVLVLSLAAVRVASPRLRIALLLGPFLALNLLSVGTVISPALRGAVALLPIDASFTGRTEVWQIAVDAIARAKLLGHGFQSFWGSAGVVFGTDDPYAWAQTASTSHNAHLEIALAAGLPGLALALVVYAWLPLRDLSRRAAGDPAADAFALLCLRLWLLGLYLASFEAFILSRADPLWFSLALALCGLRYSSAFRLRP